MPSGRLLGARLRLGRGACLFRSDLIGDAGCARKEPLSALDGAGKLRCSVAIGAAGGADFRSLWCNLGRRFYESFYRNLFPGVGRFHVESAGDLTMRLS